MRNFYLTLYYKKFRTQRSANDTMNTHVSY